MVRNVRNGKVRKVSRVEGTETPSAKSISLAYTYAGEGEEEVFALKKIARQWARLGKARLARALAELADDLQMGIAMGAIAPGDTVYRLV
jgi:hypothetical protein